MGDESCRDSRTWEEEIYWGHFQCHHFSQFLRSGFRMGLAIPKEFTKNLRKALPKIVFLKGPSGQTWEVGLATNDDTVFFNNGWELFSDDHLLQEKDLLTFKYNGDSTFDVLVFDGHSLCEKPASYFVRKCGHREQDSSSKTKRKIKEVSAEATPHSPEHHIEGPAPEKSDNNDVDTTPLTQPITSTASTKKVRMQMGWFSKNIHEEPSTSIEEVDIKPDIESLSPSLIHDVPYISSRKLITEEEKQNALQLAMAAVTSDGFMVVMKPTHVYRRFYMSIPSSWMAKNLTSLEKQDVVLRIKDNQWVTKFYYQKSRHSGGLSSGWKKFALANELQEFDVCVFEPGGHLHGAIVLDVNIIRVDKECL